VAAPCKERGSGAARRSAADHHHVAALRIHCVQA
jgi:hypothetical protein